MKKSIFFPILALLLCIGFSSCKPKENEYTLFFKVEKQTPDTEDSLMTASFNKEYLSVLRTYMEVLDADRGLNFILTATDEEELKTKVSELNNQVVERLNSTELQGFYIVGLFRSQNEKESTELLSTKLGTPLDQGNWLKVHELVDNDGWDETIPMSSEARFIYKIQLDNWFEESNIYNNLAIDADLNEGAGGKYIYIHGAYNNYLQSPITDVIVLHTSVARGENFTFKYKGRTYYSVDTYGEGGLNGDLNQDAEGLYLYLMYTKESFGDNHRLVNMCIYTGNYDFRIPDSAMGDGIVAVPMISESTGEIETYKDRYCDQVDLNEDAGGRWIRMLCKYR